MPIIDAALASEQYCYLTTRGRRTGNPHTIEIWFDLDGDTLYMLSGRRDRSDWLQNLRRDANVSVRIGNVTYVGSARIVAPESEEDALARRLLLEKYAPGYSGSLSEWGRTALPVAVDIVSVESRR